MPAMVQFLPALWTSRELEEKKMSNEKSETIDLLIIYDLTRILLAREKRIMIDCCASYRNLKSRK